MAWVADTGYQGRDQFLPGGTAHRNPYQLKADGTANPFYKYLAIADMNRTIQASYWSIGGSAMPPDPTSGTDYHQINIQNQTNDSHYYAACMWIAPDQILFVYHRKDDGTFSKVWTVGTSVSTENTITTLTYTWSYPQGKTAMYMDEFGIVHATWGTRNNSGNGITQMAWHYPEDSWTTWSVNANVVTGTLGSTHASCLVRRKGYLYLITSKVLSGNNVYLLIYRRPISADPTSTWTLIHTTGNLDDPNSQNNRYKVYGMIGTLLADGTILVAIKKWWNSGTNYRILMARVSFVGTSGDTFDAVSQSWIEDDVSTYEYGNHQQMVAPYGNGGAICTYYIPNTWSEGGLTYSIARQVISDDGDTWGSAAITTVGTAGNATIAPRSPLMNSNPVNTLDGNLSGLIVHGDPTDFHAKEWPQIWAGQNTPSGTRPILYHETSAASNLSGADWGRPLNNAAHRRAVDIGASPTHSILVMDDNGDVFHQLTLINSNNNVFREAEAAYIRVLVWEPYGSAPTQTGQSIVTTYNDYDSGWFHGTETAWNTGSIYGASDKVRTRWFFADAAMQPILDAQDGNILYIESDKLVGKL